MLYFINNMILVSNFNISELRIYLISEIKMRSLEFKMEVNRNNKINYPMSISQVKQ